jgi:hypothetical protein
VARHADRTLLLQASPVDTCFAALPPYGLLTSTSTQLKQTKLTQIHYNNPNSATMAWHKARCSMSLR